MVRIRQCAWTRFRIPFVTPFGTARTRMAVREGVLVRLSTADGLARYGEASIWTGFGTGTLPDLIKCVHATLPELVGLEVSVAAARIAALDIRQPGNAGLASAVDTALLDLQAATQGVPAAAYLGGSLDQPVPVNATIGVADTQGAVAAARKAVADGFDCVKLKVAVMPSEDDELERIAAVRRAAGRATRLRLDANGAWQVEQAVSLIRAAEQYDLELVEQPVATIAELAQVRSRVQTRIAADESAGSIAQVREVLQHDAADVLVVKLLAAGGIRNAREIIRLAQEAGSGAIVTTSIDTGIGTAAALHLAATLPQPRLACGLATAGLLEADLLVESLPVRQSVMPLPEQPGLGIAVDEAQVARYCDGWRVYESTSHR